MSTPTGKQPVRIPSEIVVVREKGTGSVRLEIDGEELPYALSSAGDVDVSLGLETPPGVRFTLLAASVRVEDRLFAGVDLNEAQHEHDDDGEDGDLDLS